MKIAKALRRLVFERANNCCEYCLLSSEDSFLRLQVSLIIAKQDGGETVADNLCVCCPDCYALKGSVSTALEPLTNTMTPLYNPRTQVWREHFLVHNVRIEPRTKEGSATVYLLQFNSAERMLERETLLEMGRYPPRGATEG